MDRWDDAYRSVVQRVIRDGSPGLHHRGPTHELIAEQFQVTDPRDRCLMNLARSFNVFQATGHWLWILAGRFDVPSIEYYNKSVGKMSVDGRKLDGAYGPRLFGTATNSQIPHAIELILSRGETRRAVATVYSPDQDTIRRVVDGREDEVPCTVALQYLPRGGRLHAVTVMRSQEVLKVLPYDMFIFTLLQEYVARSTNLELGSYIHFASSLHTYQDDDALATAVLADQTRSGPLMPQMPPGPQDEHLRTVFQLEENIRNDAQTRARAPGRSKYRPTQFIHEAEKLPPFWREVVYSLIVYAAATLKETDVIHQMHSLASPAIRPFVERAWVRASPVTPLESYIAKGGFQ